MENMNVNTSINNNGSLVKFGKTLFGGVIAGIIAAVLANVMTMIVEDITGYSFKELTVVSITAASMVTNIIGSIVYYFFVNKSKKPIRLYVILALFIATLDSILATINAPAQGFGLIATPIHYIVAITSIIVVPQWSRKYDNHSKSLLGDRDIINK